MSSIQEVNPSTQQRERLFFLIMAAAIAVTVPTSFLLWYLAGISSFNAPWWVHVHAVTFMGWIGFYLVQNTLVLRDDVAIHQRLGRIGAVYVVWMVLVGLALTPMTIAAHRTPPIFTPPFFLALDWVNVTAFGALVCAAILNRHRSDWHKRLMLCATVCVMAPAAGRVIVLSGATMTAPLNVAVLSLWIVIGMLFDWHYRGRVHPAYAWGAGALVTMAVAIEGISRIPAFAAFANGLAS